MDSEKISQILDIKENLLKRSEKAENGDLKLDIKEKFLLFIDFPDSKQKAKVLDEEISKRNALNKDLEEQIDLKESERVEYEEGDLKSMKEFAYELKYDDKKLEHTFKTTQASLIEMYSQSDALIGQLLKYEKKLNDIPALLKSDLAKAETIIENQTYKLASIKQAMQDCYKQDEMTLAEIAKVDGNINKVLEKSKELTNSIDIENSLTAQIVEYQEQILPEIASEIEKIKMNIMSAESKMTEKNEVKNKTMNIFNDLREKLQIEQAKDKTLHENLQSIMKLKNDMVNTGISHQDIEVNPILKNLVHTKEFKKQKDKITKLRADNAQIIKDAQDAKNKKDESEKALKQLKEEIKKNEELSKVKNDEIISFEKDIDEKEAEFESLTAEILEMKKTAETHDGEINSVEANIAELNNTYKELSKKLNSIQNKYRDSDLKETQIEAVDMSVSINNNRNNVHKWLHGLPKKFSKDSSNSDILSQTSTVNFDSSINVSTLHQMRSKDASSHDILFNLDIDDPELIEANMDCSFSDLNASDIGTEESYTNLI